MGSVTQCENGKCNSKSKVCQGENCKEVIYENHNATGSNNKGSELPEKSHDPAAEKPKLKETKDGNSENNDGESDL